MGFSTTAAFAIIMISIFISVSFIAGELVKSFNDLNLAIKKQEHRKYELENTDFKISSVYAWNITSSSYNVRIELSNTGAVTLDSSKFAIIVDGICYENFTYNSSNFYPLEGLQLQLNNLPGGESSVHRLKIVSENGAERYATFTVN
jgi:archaellum component FlaF (FlaF/FlaG flagellin family)